MFLRAVLPSLSVSRFCRSELARDSSDAVRLPKRGAAIASKLGSYRGGVVLGVSVGDAIRQPKRGDAIASKLGSYRGGVVLGVSVGDAVCLPKRGDAIASKLGCYRGGVCQSGAQPFNTMRMMVWVAAS